MLPIRACATPVHMRKRNNLAVLRGKDQRVLIAAGGRHFDSALLLRRWLRRRLAAGVADTQALFCHEGGRPITTAEVRAVGPAYRRAEASERHQRKHHVHFTPQRV